MFDLRNFIKKGFIDAIGDMPDYKIRLNSAGWLDKGVLLEEDLADINEQIEATHIEEIPEEIEEPTEEELPEVGEE